MDLDGIAEVPAVVTARRTIFTIDHIKARRDIGLHVVYLRADGEGGHACRRARKQSRFETVRLDARVQNMIRRTRCRDCECFRLSKVMQFYSAAAAASAGWQQALVAFPLSILILIE